MFKIIEINKHQSQFRFRSSQNSSIRALILVKPFSVVFSQLVCNRRKIGFIVHLVYFIICVERFQAFYLPEQKADTCLVSSSQHISVYGRMPVILHPHIGDQEIFSFELLKYGTAIRTHIILAKQRRDIWCSL